MMLNELALPIIFAHRGASAYAPENTLAAFELAERQGAGAIELDTKLTADGEVVVIHDQTLDRTTSAKGKVRDHKLTDIRKLDAGSHFDLAFKGEKIPTLAEVLVTLGQRLFINIEIANYATPNDELPFKVAAIVKKLDLSQRVLFSSFNPLALWRARKVLPKTPIGLLATPGSSGQIARSWIGSLLGYQSLHPEKGDVTPSLVTKAHKKGKLVFVYTVNQAEDMLSLFKMKVDGIFTDDPVLANEIRNSLHKDYTSKNRDQGIN